MHKFFERYFYAPNLIHKFIAFLLLPLSFIYFIITMLRRKFSIYHDFNLPLISVGNLVLGGSGKTPISQALAQHFIDKKPAIVLRGYGRKSKDLVVVRDFNNILEHDVEISGDEAQMLAKMLQNCTIIVSKNRYQGILKAREMGAGLIILDDGFRFNFAKFNILLKPELEPALPFTLPSGGYREAPFLYKSADLILEEYCVTKSSTNYFIRKAKLLDPTERMILVTAISKPDRLLKFLGDYEILETFYFDDHASFDLDFLRQKMSELKATSIICTQKDAVKLKGFALSILDLEIIFSKDVLNKIEHYVENFKIKIGCNGSCPNALRAHL
ncbi:MAG: tetraacyldisaccharide 4'-kinase [Helicobacter sp.]|nr:tetraacyldisaccharide 4'-kinase [Helicobacter sp.]